LTLVQRLKQWITRTGLPVPRRLPAILDFLQVGPWLRAQAPAPHFETRDDLYAHLARGFAAHPIDYLEFGVFEGETIRTWARLHRHPDSRFFGFDSFEGLPEAWALPGKIIRKGQYDAKGRVPVVDDPRVGFVTGLFQDSLRGFLRDYTPGGQLVVHCDADLHSSTLYVLATLDEILAPGSVIVFDELSGGAEFRAFRDYTSAFRRSARLLGTASYNYAQAALEIR
jgi:hypothetical protein